MTLFDPTDPAFRQNPYPTYAALRTQAPIAFWEERNLWLLTRWADCNAVLRDNRFGNDPVGLDMLFQNPPDHTRLRSLMQKAFTPRRIELLRDQIQTITDGLLDQVQGEREIDLISALAYPLPVAVIAALMGVPAADHTRFHEWSNALVDSLDLVQDATLAERLATAESGFRAYFDDLIRERRRNPGDDLLSALIAAEEAGDRLSGDELYFNARLLLIAGYETTVGLIGNGVLALLRNPAQRKLLQEQSGLIANHDSAHLTDPERLDITRPTVQHLAFGSGIHYCLGAPLARIEGQIAIQTLLRRFPNLQLAEEAPPHRDNFVFRSLQRLPVVAGKALLSTGS